MTGPLNPDPLVPTDVDAAYADGYAAGWDDAPRKAEHHRGLSFAIGILVGSALVLGFLAGRAQAAPRPAQPVIPAVAPHPGLASSARVTPATSGNLAGRTGAPLLSAGASLAHTPTPDPGPASGASSIAAVKGVASWYGTSGPGIYAAAGPALRVGRWRGRTVEVCGNGSCVRLRLTDWCACPRRVIDLSSDAFRRLAPLSQGLVLVRVAWGGDAVPPPATDR